MIVLDSHCDAPTMLADGADFGSYVEGGQVDYSRMQKGGVDASFFAIYTSNERSGESAALRALEMIAHLYDSLEENRDIVSLATTVDDIIKNKELGKISILLGMENGLPIQKDLSLLRLFYRMGVRYLTLTHNGDNEICDSAASPDGKWGGLSPFGIKVVSLMNQLGMMIDVSHISDAAFYDVIKYSSKPPIASHSCCRELCGHRRNMSDDMIRAIAQKGGVIQVNFYPPFLSDNYENEEITSATVANHIDHIVSLVGIDYVGIGTDFDGIEMTPNDLKDVSQLPNLFEELRKRGYSEEDIEKISGANFLRVMRENEQ